MDNVQYQYKRGSTLSQELGIARSGEKKQYDKMLGHLRGPALYSDMLINLGNLSLPRFFPPKHMDPLSLGQDEDTP
jgi:hypothetical protein